VQLNPVQQQPAGKKILIMYFNYQKWAYISGFLKFWGLPNFGGLKPLLKWLCGWAGPACTVAFIFLIRAESSKSTLVIPC
jgi:hypothetical protein